LQLQLASPTKKYCKIEIDRKAINQYKSDIQPDPLIVQLKSLVYQILHQIQTAGVGPFQ
jgi:hypothetical protein